jgi:hypothetical protein
VLSVRPVEHSAFTADTQGNRYRVEQRARQVMLTAAADAGVHSITDVGNGEFVVTRTDGSTFHVRVTSHPTLGNSLGQVRASQQNRAEIHVSPYVAPRHVGRVLANAVAQASTLLNGNRITDNVLGRQGHPGSRTELSPDDQGRQAEVRHLDRAKQETARLHALRRRAIAREMRALVEELGLHPDDDVAPHRRAVADVGDTIDLHVAAGDRRPVWVKPPSGFPTWRAFLTFHLPAEMLPGLGAGIAIALTGAPVVGTAIGASAITAGVANTLIKRWYGRIDKTNTDTGHGYAIAVRTYESFLRRKQLLDPLLARLTSAGFPVQGPVEPTPEGTWPARYQAWYARLAMRGGPAIIGAGVASSFMLAGLPVWTAAAQVGAALAAASIGTVVERYLRNSLVRREWALLDNVGREKDRVAARYDELFAHQLSALIDRIDNLAGRTPGNTSPTADPVRDREVNNTRLDHYGANQMAGGVGPAAQTSAEYGVHRWAEHLDAAALQQATNSVLAGGVRALLGTVVNSFLDRSFIPNEYKVIVEQVHFDFGGKMAEQVTVEQKALDVMLADLTARVDAAEAAVHRVNTSLAARVAHLKASTPPAPKPGDLADRPLGHQRWQAFLRLHGIQAATAWGTASSMALLLGQGVGPIAVLGGVALGIFASFPLRYAFRHAEQLAVDETILGDRVRERPVELAEAVARQRFFIELLNREVEVATGQRPANAPRPTSPAVPKWPLVSDPDFVEHVAKRVAYEREVLFHEMRPYSLLGQKLTGLDRLDRLVQRVRDFAANGQQRPLEQARKELRKLWLAYDDLKNFATPLPTDHELLLNNKPQGMRGGDPTAVSQTYDSIETPAGRAYYTADDEQLLSEAHTVPPEPGQYTIDMHGGPDHVRIGTDRLTAAEFAALMRADPHWHGEPIRLLACETGQRANGFAQQLADELGVTVHAPSDYVGLGADGLFVSVTGLDANGNPQPVMPPTGSFYTFEPTVHGTPAQEQVSTTPHRLAVRSGQYWPDHDNVEFDAMRAPDPPGPLGELTLMRDGPTVYTGADQLWPDELADILTAEQDWAHGPTRLQVSGGQVDADFVQRLADLLGQPVIVPGDAVGGDIPTLSSGTLEVYNEPSAEAPPGCRVYAPRHVAAGKGTP